MIYIAGSENVVADALSQIYSNDSAGTERAKSEHTYHDVVDDDTADGSSLQDAVPILAGIEARIVTRRGSRSRRPSQKVIMAASDSSAIATASKASPAVTATSTAAVKPPESSRAFAAQMKGRFVLKGPRPSHEPTEGRNTDNTDNTDIATELPSLNPTVNGEPNIPEGSLLNIVSQSLQGLDLLDKLRGKFGLDPAFKPILNRPNDFRNFEVDGQLVYMKAENNKLLCIPKIMIQGCGVREVVISEAHSMLAHLGASKTIDYLRDHVWWKDMVSDIRAFCETCHTCKISKPSNQKPYGLLNPLSVPSYPWELIGMDFVGPLPELGNRDGFSTR